MARLSWTRRESDAGHVKAALADAIRSLAPFEDLANGLPTGAMEKIEATAEPGSGQAMFRSIVICAQGRCSPGRRDPGVCEALAERHPCVKAFLDKRWA